MSQFLSTQKVATTIDNKINKIKACAIGLPIIIYELPYIFNEPIFKGEKINFDTKQPIMAINYMYASFTANMHTCSISSCTCSSSAWC